MNQTEPFRPDLLLGPAQLYEALRGQAYSAQALP